MHPVVPRAHWGGLATSGPDAEVAILGVPYDGGVGWRPGAAEAPSRLRDLSGSSPAISEEGYVVDPERLRVRDLGDVVPEVQPDTTSAASGGRAERIRDAASPSSLHRG
jgi:arginase family enzyme